MKKLIGVLCSVLAGGLFAADGTWIVTSGTLNYTDTANWKDGVVAGDGGTMTVTNTAATTVNLDGTVTLGKIVGVVNNFFYFNSGTWVMTEPATICNNSRYAEGNTLQFQGTSTIQTAGDLTLTGVARIVLMNANDIGGRFVVSGPEARARAKTEACLGPTPADYVADAVVLDGGTLENADGNTWLTFSPNRGIYVTENNGYLGASCSGSGGVRVQSKITGPGSFGVNGQNLSVYIANPGNDYRGDTIIGSTGPGFASIDAKFRTEADEVIPHGEGFGVLQLGPDSTYLRGANYTSPNKTARNMVSHSRLYLQNHTETVNAVEGGARGHLHGGTLILGSNADSHFNGVLESDATLVKRGTGTLWMPGGHTYGKLVLEEGTLALAPHYLHANASLEAKGGRLVLAGPTGGWVESAAAAYGYPNFLQTFYSGNWTYNAKWYIPETKNYSFARSLKGTCSLTIDGVEILSGTAADNALTVVRDVQMTEGWHTVRITANPGNALSTLLPAGLMYDAGNGAFSTDEEIFRAREFSDDNGPNVRADGGVFRTDGKIVVSGPVTVSKDEFLSKAIFGGLVTTDPENPQTMTVDLPEGERLYIGSTSLAAPARVEAPIVGAYAYCDYAWLTVPPAANASFAEHAMPVLGYDGALSQPITLTDHSLRVTDPATGSATITVGAGEILRFDTLDLIDGAYNDAAGKPVRTFTNNVVLDGGTLVLAGASDIVLAGTVSGTGVILKEGAGVAAITGDVTVDADSQVQVTAGTLRLSSAGAAAVSITGGRLANVENTALDLSANTVTLNGGNFQTDGGAIVLGDGFAGKGSVYGTGTLRLVGTTAGTAEVAARESTTLELAKDGVASLATVTEVEYGATVKIATDAANWWSGSLTLKGGTLDLNGHDLTVTTLNSTSPFSTIVNNGAEPVTFTIDNAAALSTKCNFRSGTGGLSVVKRGAGALTLYGKVHCTAFTVEAGTVVSQPSTGVKGTAVRMIPWTSRPSGSYVNTGVQFGEFILKRGGVNLAWPAGTTASTVNTYNLGNNGNQNAAKIIDGAVNASSKLYDTVYANPMVISFGAEMAFENYDLATGGDAEGRDPYSWSLEVGCTENGTTVWYPCSSLIDYACTTTRNAWMNGNFPVADYSPRFTGTAVTVASGATLELHHVDEPFAALTVDGTLVRDSKSSVAAMPTLAAGTKLRTQATSRAKYFRFTIVKTETGNTNMQISEFQVWLDGARVAWPAGTTATWSGGTTSSAEVPAKILDGATNTKCFTGGALGAFTITAPTPIAFNSYCWYTANDDYNRDPVSWTLEVSDDGENWTLLDKVDDRACPAARQSLAYASEPVGATLDPRVWARYLKFAITDIRGGATQMQFSEFEVLTNGVKVAWPANTRLGWSLHRTKNTSDTENPTKVIDGNTGTKFFTGENGLGEIMIYCPNGIAFDAYRWYTANDSATTRDPIGWKLLVSIDGINWREVDNVPEYDTTSTRNVVAYTSPKLSENLGVLPDAAVATLDDSTLSLGGPETIGGVAGAGTLEVWGETTLDVAEGTTETFNGTVAGRGALVKAGAGVQVLKGAVTLNGPLVVKEGELRLDQATLSAGLVIVLEGGTLTGTATCEGDLVVQSNGGAYGAAIALTGTLSLTGDLKLAPNAGYATRRVCFEYGATDDASKTKFLSAPCSVELPGKYIYKTSIVGNQMKLNIYPACTIIYVR
ncbi:MAG: discoidin domain-containing protein [Kiritimatiellae bacterium]|nr:discoidin domain-containing protein [Kiritimatiellia bacterium]